MELASEILSDVTVYMKYARYLESEKRRETWEELVTRNKQMHQKKYPQIYDDIERAYQLVMDKKVLPSMRSLQFGGKPIEISPNRVYNCAYLPVDDWRSFGEILFLLLGGTGVGYSVQSHHVEQLPEIKKPNPNKTKRFLVGDSIEGWADSVKMLMKSYFRGTATLDFDFSDIRPKGAQLITSGGKAPGPEPLKICLRQIKSILNEKEDGDQLRPIEVHDIVCHIADAVLAGGIRRAALISLFSADDEEMISCKYGNWYELNPQRGRANNSAVLLRHKVSEEFFFDLWEKIRLSNSGEPGIYFSNDKDYGTNPCCEIALRPYQFCNLCEVNASTVESQEDLENRIKAATLIGTLQAGYTNFHYLRSIWQKTTEREAAAAAAAKEKNKEISKIIGIKAAARITTIKPAGTTSLALGCSSGIHAWHNDYYIRRIRVGKNESIYKYLADNHPELVEDEYFRPHDTAVISVPQKAPEGATLRSESSLELLERIKWFSKNWIKPGHARGQNTHNISATVSIKDDEWETVGKWMWENRKYYNGISCLPYDGGSYVQQPFEDCTKETYEKMMGHLKGVDLTEIIESEDNTDLKGELACAGGACEIK
jgi:ribonucleoside-diphosphate reductase alpha chain